MRSRIRCVHIETSSLWEDFVNKNRCICVRLVSDRRLKALNFDNSHDSFLWPEYFIDFYVKDGSHARLRDPSCVYITASTLQYKRCVHLWNNFPCIITLEKLLWGGNFVLGISRSIFDLGLLLIYRDNLVFIQYPQCDITLKGKLKWRDLVLILELQVPKMNIGINLHYEDTSIPALIK